MSAENVARVYELTSMSTILASEESTQTDSPAERFRAADELHSELGKYVIDGVRTEMAKRLENIDPTRKFLVGIVSKELDVLEQEESVLQMALGRTEDANSTENEESTETTSDYSLGREEYKNICSKNGVEVSMATRGWNMLVRNFAGKVLHGKENPIKFQNYKVVDRYAAPVITDVDGLDVLTLRQLIEIVTKLRVGKHSDYFVKNMFGYNITNKMLDSWRAICEEKLPSVDDNQL